MIGEILVYTFGIAILMLVAVTSVAMGRIE